MNLRDDYADFSTVAARLAALEGHGRSGDRSAGGEDMRGSPFLDGPTVTIAGADLQQRVASAVASVGGNVLSSQIDLQGSQANEGYVILSASCEITQDALQPLLYDLEAGMPFLFVEQLVVQAPQSAKDTGRQTNARSNRRRRPVAGSQMSPASKFSLALALGISLRRQRLSPGPRAILRRYRDAGRRCAFGGKSPRSQAPRSGAANPLWAIPLESLTRDARASALFGLAASAARLRSSRRRPSSKRRPRPRRLRSLKNRK